MPRTDCLANGQTYGQKTDIANVKLDGVDAKSFYTDSTGVGGPARIVQTINEPMLQIQTIDSSLVNDPVFDQILSTFKFLN